MAAKTALGPAEATSEPEKAADAIPPVAAAPQQSDCRLPAVEFESVEASPFPPSSFFFNPPPSPRLLSTTSESTTTSAHAVEAAATSVAASTPVLVETKKGLAIAAQAAAPETPHRAR